MLSFYGKLAKRCNVTSASSSSNGNSHHQCTLRSNKRIRGKRGRLSCCIRKVAACWSRYSSIAKQSFLYPAYYMLSIRRGCSCHCSKTQDSSALQMLKLCALPLKGAEPACFKSARCRRTQGCPCMFPRAVWLQRNPRSSRAAWRSHSGLPGVQVASDCCPRGHVPCVACEVQRQLHDLAGYFLPSSSSFLAESLQRLVGPLCYMLWKHAVLSSRST